MVARPDAKLVKLCAADEVSEKARLALHATCHSAVLSRVFPSFSFD